MKRLTSKQRGPWCDHCEERAVWRSYAFTGHACDTHKYKLELKEKREGIAEDVQTDAEFQLGV